MPKSEAEARRKIDEALTKAGWAIQSMATVNLSASRGVAVEEVALTTGEADYLLFVDGVPAGIVEAKKEGTTLTGVEIQSGSYSDGLPTFSNRRSTRCRSCTKAPESKRNSRTGSIRSRAMEASIAAGLKRAERAAAPGKPKRARSKNVKDATQLPL